MFLIRSGAIEGYEQLVTLHGQNPASLLQQFGFSSAQLRDPNTYVSYTRLAALLDDTALACGDPLFGLNLAAGQSLLALGEIGLSIRQQPSLADALTYSRQHISLHAHGVHLQQEPRGDILELQLTFDFSNASGLAQLMQLSAGQAFNLVSQMLGSTGNALKLHLPQPAPKAESVVPAAYGEHIYYNSNFGGVGFPLSWLSRKPQYDEQLLREHFQQRIHLLESIYPGNLQAQVCHIIGNLLPSGECGIERVSAALNLHPRVLQKKLQQDGTSFRALLQQTRMEIAQRNLQHGQLSITDLALNLGYADVAIFSRNFKRWTQLSPREWRAKSKGLNKPDD
ncbi:AraC family transcriptional regulator [Microbulbifer sp. CAU 1566]|uniref:helix-turn-helix transcriptional regulator n=1 Tax=Microbulbifer sp. CAU 1566 TaxID=2933269 RepID=UPI0020039B95|nr:AraC family transcriptional regulator [Microbulbifer sp. CAU 1566]MCK7597655.1 AraC family transcriptional regulator [Microbulbifer sp. CAU 1566]